MTGLAPMPPFAPMGQGAYPSSVARAYYGMLECGVSPYGALNAAARVYCYHNPDETMKIARSRVERWLNVRILQ